MRLSKIAANALSWISYFPSFSTYPYFYISHTKALFDVLWQDQPWPTSFSDISMFVENPFDSADDFILHNITHQFVDKYYRKDTLPGKIAMSIFIPIIPVFSAVISTISLTNKLSTNVFEHVLFYTDDFITPDDKPISIAEPMYKACTEIYGFAANSKLITHLYGLTSRNGPPSGDVGNAQQQGVQPATTRTNRFGFWG